MRRRQYVIVFAVNETTPPEVVAMSSGGEMSAVSWKRAAYLVGELVRWGYAVTVRALEIG